MEDESSDEMNDHYSSAREQEEGIAEMSSPDNLQSEDETEDEPITPFFFLIRTSKFDLRLNVLIQKPF